MKTLISLMSPVLVFLMLMPGNVYAQHYDYAEVLDVTPIYRTVEVIIPQQECWNERVVHRERSDRGGMILGGLIGGAIGNRFGEGEGRKAAIAVGTLLGAGIGQNMQNDRERTYATTEQRCEVINTYRTEERLDGYRVKYMYNGSIYHTRTETDPGDQLRVRVTVQPMQ